MLPLTSRVSPVRRSAVRQRGADLADRAVLFNDAQPPADKGTMANLFDSADNQSKVYLAFYKRMVCVFVRSDLPGLCSRRVSGDLLTPMLRIATPLKRSVICSLCRLIPQPLYAVPCLLQLAQAASEVKDMELDAKGASELSLVRLARSAVRVTTHLIPADPRLGTLGISRCLRQAYGLWTQQSKARPSQESNGKRVRNAAMGRNGTCTGCQSRSLD